MAAKSNSKQDVLQFLDDLDSLSPPVQRAPGNPSAPATGTNEGEAEVLAFLDEITQKSAEPTRTTSSHRDRPISRSGTPTFRKSTDRVRVGTPSGSSLRSSSPSPSSLAIKTTATEGTNSTPKEQTANSGDHGQNAANPGGWGWGSVWSTASAAIQQAKSAVDEQVKFLPKNEQARKWGEGVIEYAKTAQLDKLGQDFKRVGLSTLTDILNVVAPPISEHEVIQVWLSHDMRGYEGIESLVYRALARIMEQVEGGDLIVNKGDESRPKDVAGDGRDLNAAEGYEAAFKLSQANLDELIKHNSGSTQSQPSSTHAATTYSHVYIRVQPFFTSFTLPLPEHDSSSAPTSPATPSQHLQFIIYLSDPAHNLVHTTVTQAVPRVWLDVWDQYEWVEDLVAEALRVGVEIIGQEYVVARMGWIGKATQGGKEVKEEDKGEGTQEES